MSGRATRPPFKVPVSYHFHRKTDNVFTFYERARKMEEHVFLGEAFRTAVIDTQAKIANMNARWIDGINCNIIDRPPHYEACIAQQQRQLEKLEKNIRYWNMANDAITAVKVNKVEGMGDFLHAFWKDYKLGAIYIPVEQSDGSFKKFRLQHASWQQKENKEFGTQPWLLMRLGKDTFELDGDILPCRPDNMGIDAIVHVTSDAVWYRNTEIYDQFNQFFLDVVRDSEDAFMKWGQKCRWCMICGRQLTSKLALERGIGSDCWKRVHPSEEEE